MSSIIILCHWSTLEKILKAYVSNLDPSLEHVLIIN